MSNLDLRAHALNVYDELADNMALRLTPTAPLTLTHTNITATIDTSPPTVLTPTQDGTDVILTLTAATKAAMGEGVWRWAVFDSSLGATLMSGVFVLEAYSTTGGTGGSTISVVAGEAGVINVTVAAVAGGSGDMLASVYDPTTVAGDAFAMGNMVEGADAKIMTGAERTKLTNAPADTNAALAGKSDTTHLHTGVYDPAGTAAGITQYTEAATYTNTGASYAIDFNGDPLQRLNVDQATVLDIANCGVGKMVTVLLKNPTPYAITWQPGINFGTAGAPDDGDGIRLVLIGYSATAAQAAQYGGGGYTL